MNGSNTAPSYTSSSSSFTACSSSPFFLPTVPPLSPSTHLTDDSDCSIILEHVFYCQGPRLVLEPISVTRAVYPPPLTLPNR